VLCFSSNGTTYTLKMQGVLDMSGFHTPCYIGHTMPKVML
jgi:hypothetical protein